MKKIININFQGQLITIEETAYDILNRYIQDLKRYFRNESDGNEIVNDIENRIAELLGNRLKHGISCITDEDIKAIINTIGRPEEFDIKYDEGESESYESATNNKRPQMTPVPPADKEKGQLSRNANDKIVAGVCGGIAHYFRIEPVFIRLLFVMLSSLLFWVYIILWIILPIKNLTNNVKKRLYRNPSEKIIAGVCSGIATYFKVDVWIPRLIFLLPLLFNAFDFIEAPLRLANKILNDFSWGLNINLSLFGLYIVLWIIMPKATSTKQKLEMMGEEEYLDSIRTTMSESVAHVKNKTDLNNYNNLNSVDSPTNIKDIESGDENVVYNNYASTIESNMPPPLENSKDYKKENLKSHKSTSTLWTIVGTLLKIAFLSLTGVVAASLMLSVVVLLFVGVQFLPLRALIINAGFENVLLFSTIILTLGVPAIGSIIWIVRRIKGLKSRMTIGYVVTFVWLIGIVSSFLLGYKIINKFRVENVLETNITIESPTNDKLYLHMMNYPDDYYNIAPNYANLNFDQIPFYNQTEDSLLYDAIQLKMKVSKDSLFHVKTIYMASGENRKTVKSNLREMTYNLHQNDSVLWLPQFFAVPLSQGYRKQHIIVEMYVPNGKTIEVSEELEIFQREIYSNILLQKNRRRGQDDDFDWNSDTTYKVEDAKLVSDE